MFFRCGGKALPVESSPPAAGDGTEIASNTVDMKSRQKSVATFFVSLWLSGTAQAAEPSSTAQWQSHDSIRRAAEQAVRETLATQGQVKAVAENVDQRLRLTACAAPLATEINGGNPRGRKRVTVRVRCPSERPWKIHVAVRLTVLESVVVASRPLPRNWTLQESDIKLAERESSSLEYGYLTRVEDALGMQLRRPLSAGQALAPGALGAPILVRRGQNVTLVADAGALKVRVNGIAMEDGSAGEVINVQNLSSKRKVQAVVRSEKSVEVLLN